MKRVIYLSIPFAAALLCVSAAEARADDAPRPADAPEVVRARTIFEEGKRLMAAGDYTRAVERFRASRALHAGVGNTRNLAHCLGELDRLDEALEVYEDLLGRFGGELTPDIRTRVINAMTLYRRSVGSVDVSADVDGLVFVDGRPRGQLPLAGTLRLLPGKHLVRIAKGGYATHEATVVVAVGQTATLDAKLTPLLSVGRLRVEVDPKGELATRGQLTVDGSPVGDLPWEGNLAPGPHVLFASSGDAGSDMVSVVVVQAQAVTTTLVAHPLSAPLRVRVEPPTAGVSIDGVAVGRGAFEGRLPVGDHEIAVEEDGYTTARFTVHATRDSAGDRRVALVADAKHPRWKSKWRVGIEAVAGPLVSTSLHSGAEPYAGGGLAAGGFVAARFGVEAPIRLAADLSVGWLALNRDVTRSLKETYPMGDQFAHVRYEVQDTLSIRGPFVGLGLRHRIPFGRDRFDLRLGLGVAIGMLSARDASTTVVTSANGSAVTTTDNNGVPTTTVAVFLTPEVEARYRLGPIEVGVGLGAAAFLTQGLPSANGETRVNVRAGACPRATPTDIRCVPGSLVLANEEGFGRLVAWAPRLVAGWSF